MNRLLDVLMRPLSRLALRRQRRHKQCLDCNRWFDDVAPGALAAVPRSTADARLCKWCEEKQRRAGAKNERAAREIFS